MKDDIVFLLSKTHPCGDKAKCFSDFNLEGINLAYNNFKIVDISRC